MADERKATLFYGYQTNIASSDIERIRDKANNIGLELKVLKEDEAKTILGKKVKTLEQVDTAQITANEFLDNVTSIRPEAEIKELEKELNLSGEQPTLILCLLDQ